MTTEFHKILIIQTAFIGDVVLTLPLAQTLKKSFPTSQVDFVAVPKSAQIIEGHPAITKVYQYDKHGKDSGVAGFLRLRRAIAEEKYELALIPHRSLRSALLAWSAGIPQRIGFDRSAGKMLLTKIVRYDSSRHEIDRNLSLLQPLGISIPDNELPHIFLSQNDVAGVDDFLRTQSLESSKIWIALAPGSIWATKRWLPERYAELSSILSKDYQVFLVGGMEDVGLCEFIRAGNPSIINCAGELSVKQSAELIRRCRLLVSNDSAPMHLAVGVGTPVVAIFGATVPEFGFVPRGEHDVVVQAQGLQCRPCAIHGGNSCPIQSFDCMKQITVEQVMTSIKSVLVSTQQ